MGITIRDVAEQAGVSIATVSRVINNDSGHRVNAATARKVIDAVIALGYTPDGMARNLRKGTALSQTSLNIGTLLTSTIDSYNDSFFHEILLGIQEEIANTGHTLRFALSLDTVSQKVVEESLRAHDLDGVILLGRMSAQTLFLVKKHVQNIIYAGLNPLNQDFDEVVCDAYGCAKAAVHYLASCGYRKIGYIGTAARSGSSTLINEHRYDGYLDAMSELGFSVKSDHVIDTPLSIEMAFHAIERFLTQKSLPEAFFCANDNCAIGALKALRTHRIRVPKDIGIIGIDDLEISAFSTPMLTTFHIPRKEIGVYSVRMLNDQIRNNRKYPIRLQLPYSLITRDSCKKPL